MKFFARACLTATLPWLILSSCHEQEKTGDGGSETARSSKRTLAAPDHFEIDFDAFFELDEPCSLTPETLEAKADALAVVPREKLYMSLQFPKETCHYHWFSATRTPVHNPTYRLFRGSVETNFISVVWRKSQMERFFCTLPAEKGQPVPQKLLADMDTALGTRNVFNEVTKEHEWDLKHYRVTIENSNNVGRGDPTLLISVHNKLFEPDIARLAKKRQRVNLDSLIDWGNLSTMTLPVLEPKVAALEKESGRAFRAATQDSNTWYHFDEMAGDTLFEYQVLDSRWLATNAYIQYSGGRIAGARFILSSEMDGKALNPEELMKYLDAKLGVPRQTLKPNEFGWRVQGGLYQFYRSSASNPYCILLETGPAAQRSLASNSPPSTPDGSENPISEPALQSMASALAKPSPDEAVTFKLRLTQVNGLLISQLASGEEAGQVTKMTLTALPNGSGMPTRIEFNQNVGQDMQKSLNEVNKLAQLRHPGWPASHRLQIGFEDKYIAKDGPSAAVACALLVESSLTGQLWDPAFAVTGDLNADGSVQPIGGVRAKVRGATRGSCRIVAVPAKNETSIPDMLLLDGPAPLVAITVFGIKSFDEALTLAKTEKPKAFGDALANFEAMRPTLLRDPRQILPLLRTPHGIARLQALLQAAPNCYSAKYLLLYAQGRSSRSLTIGGSIEAAQSSAQAIVNSIDADVDSSVKTLKPDELGTSLNKLRNLRPMLDRRVWPYVDGLVAYGEVIRGAIMNPIRSGARYVDVLSKARNAASSVQSAFKSLMSDPAVREEMGL